MGTNVFPVRLFRNVGKLLPWNRPFGCPGGLSEGIYVFHLCFSCEKIDMDEFRIDIRDIKKGILHVINISFHLTF